MKDNQDIAGSMTSESYEALRKQIEEIFNQFVWNGYYDKAKNAMDEKDREFIEDTSWAGEIHAGLERKFASEDVLQLLAKEIEAARIDEVESAWRRAPKDENCVATDIVTVYLERRLASLQATKKGDDGE